MLDVSCPSCRCESILLITTTIHRDGGIEQIFNCPRCKADFTIGWREKEAIDEIMAEYGPIILESDARWEKLFGRGPYD